MQLSVIYSLKVGSPCEPLMSFYKLFSIINFYYFQEKLVLAGSHEGACRVWTLSDQRLRVSYLFKYSTVVNVKLGHTEIINNKYTLLYSVSHESLTGFEPMTFRTPQFKVCVFAHISK